jgi:HAE1 family hydrophobic/amphiphilic exporter-1
VIVAREVMDNIETIESELPRGVQLKTIIDLSTFITRSMSNLGNTAVQAIILTFLVLLFFLRHLRSSIIVAVSIPVSMVVTFAVMDQAGLTLNVISMAGLALAVGMLVDNSIVVLESIFRQREEGEGLEDSAHHGADGVAMAITASTLTTLAVFTPVLFVPGIAGELFNDMVLTIVISLTVSLLVALTLVPLLASRFLRMRRKDTQQGDTNRSGDGKLQSVLTSLGDRLGEQIDTLQKVYTAALTWSLERRKWVILTSIGLFILSVLVMYFMGGEFMPKNDMGFMAVAVDRSAGTSLDEMEKSMHEIYRIITEQVPEVENVYSNFGQGEGIMAMFSTRTSSEGDITIRLKDLDKRDRSIFEIEDALSEDFNQIPDVNARFEDRGNTAMMGSGADIVVEIFGHDLAVAEALSNAIEEKVRDIEGVTLVKSSIEEAAPELKMNLDRQRVADLGLSTAQIGQVVSTSILGTVATHFRIGGDEYDIRVQLEEEARSSKPDIENLLIKTPMGTQIPLRAIASVDYSRAPKQILREDQERLATLSLSISNRPLSSVTDDVTEMVASVPRPSDFRIEIGGLAEEQKESFMYLGLAMLVAVLLTYMVMASQFESLLDPFIIIFTIPLSFIGVTLALVLTGTSLSVMALIGIIMLVGIVVNNGIVLVDYINQLRNKGMALRAATIKAGQVRMRPVLMTALTTILAMFPLALGLGESGESWAPMARAVMGGLTVATLLTLLVVPAVYEVVEEKTASVLAKRATRLKAKYGDELVKEKQV